MWLFLINSIALYSHDHKTLNINIYNIDIYIYRYNMVKCYKQLILLN